MNAHFKGLDKGVLMARLNQGTLKLDSNLSVFICKRLEYSHLPYSQLSKICRIGGKNYNVLPLADTI